MSEKTGSKSDEQLEYPRVRLDHGTEFVRQRTRWWQFWTPRGPPPPVKDSLGDAPVIPLANASLFSRLTYTWVTPMMILGYQRTLQATDLWKMDGGRESGPLSDRLDEAWRRRKFEAETYNKRLLSGEVSPGLLKRLSWTLRASAAGRDYSSVRELYERRWREIEGQCVPSLAWALNDTFGWFFWSAGVFKVFGDTTQLMGPLLIKAIINFAKERATARQNGSELPNVARGIGLGIGLLFFIIITSISQHQFFWRAMTTGVLARGALISSVYKRGIRFTNKARTTIPNSSLVNHISTDISRIDTCAQWFHAGWTAPVQILVCLIILLVQLGPSALAGFALFLFITPIQERVMAHQLRIRRESMKHSDQRAKTLLEILGAMRIVKYFCYEIPFMKRLYDIRIDELRGIKRIQNAQSANAAFAYSIPVLAATLAFVTYTRITEDFDVAVIFASLSLFQLLRQPMMFLPRALAATADAKNALHRLSSVFDAEVVDGIPFVINPQQELALQVAGATFEWEQPYLSKHGTASSSETSSTLAFQVRDVNMSVPRGSLVAIVGRVGSGKSSLLQGLIGEMRRVQGKVSFCGSISYCPQTAWIQNATVRDNILFGQRFNEDRYLQVIRHACLLHDISLLPNGDLTEIGEKGINLSGGQKQRISIARALYSESEIMIMDDPLSAVDAHVAEALFMNAIVGSLCNKGKTVILVTHALHFLPKCDYIYTLDDGHIMEQGTYEQLVRNEADFARLAKEFGGKMLETHKEKALDESLGRQPNIKDGTNVDGNLMTKERRSTGSVSWKVYWTYLAAGHVKITMPLLLLAVLLMQGSQIINTYTLVWWQENAFHKSFSFYQGLYAGIGICQALFTFALGLAVDTISWLVSRNLHRDSVRNLFYAKMSFFETTPAGRILGVFGKDIDTIDNQLPVSLRLLMLTLSNVFGAVIIISAIEPYFVLVACFVSLAYQYFAAYYRSSAREIKRLDAMLRSVLYAHFSESLSGLPTIKSYGQTSRFIRDNIAYLDLENRALFLAVTNQRWLAIRLDFCGAVMVFCVAVFAIVGVQGISPAQVGLVLTHTTTLTQLCGLFTRQSAEVENYMNSVERVVHYSRGDITDEEAPYEIPQQHPPEDWPQRGSITLKDVSMKYRPNLPNVLHSISLQVQPGEKIGVIGRTGAGKSSLTLCLLRIVEYLGIIKIDGVDISKIGLRALRSKIAIIPQEPTLFSGTVRTALDPFSIYDDARLWDALRRACLVDTSSAYSNSDSEVELSSENHPRMSLDTMIEPDGANLSLGERSLLSLARALVKDSKIVVLDEATASVDLETDKKIQQTIQSQFGNRTLICIAHRLRTIIAYDRILVLEAGTVAEFDTPERLFNLEDGLFRTLCNKSNISFEDILKSQVNGTKRGVASSKQVQQPV